jgi:hypothetical protein
MNSFQMGNVAPSYREFGGLLSALQVGLSLNDETEPDAYRGDQKSRELSEHVH